MENSTANIVIVIGMIIFIILGGMMFLKIRNTEQLALKNPCAACAMLTGYVCVNQSDAPAFWRPSEEWQSLTLEPNGSSQFNYPWTEGEWD